MFIPIPNFSLKAFLHISGNGGSAGGGGGRFPWALAAPHPTSSPAVVAVTALAGIAVFAAIFYTTSR
ncbi:hypothetical protein LINPERPRIM_LOCUS7588 [Linum perenne]